jgi:hypothetical protein
MIAQKKSAFGVPGYVSLSPLVSTNTVHTQATAAV